MKNYLRIHSVDVPVQIHHPAQGIESPALRHLVDLDSKREKLEEFEEKKKRSVRKSEVILNCD